MVALILKPEVSRLINSLEERTHAETLRLLTLLDKYRYELREPYTKKLSKNLFELRVRGKQEVRLLFGYKDREIVIVGGFIKKTQKTPRIEIEKAENEYRTLDI